MGDDVSQAMKPCSDEQAVFAEALQCPTPELRSAYLDAACAADTRLRLRVEALLRAAEKAGDFLEQPPAGLYADACSTTLVSDLSEKPGDRIGRYKLLEKIGEGGCGVVYMAEQEEPVRRRVALKVIRLGMDTLSVIARFEAERQALALMDHPNIAKVFDGGATPTGRPFFVMELVRGVRITDFSDEARLSTEARLRLFVQVCQAVQHAHQKGIIHRDLKPSNILVTVNDGEPVPKVIDFGIAKATGQRLTDKTLFTHFHAFIGTPAYTSPEQAQMSSVDVDTRSDIYSLGVLLYELLTGRTPFDGEEMLRSGLDEMRRTILEKEPELPSTRLRQASRNNTSPERMTHHQSLATDLDWIVMRCLEKDRARRYETVTGLASDIQRHLNHEPVTARPPSGLYLLQKFARRNRRALITAVTILTALIVALFTLASSNAQIRKERNQKDRALRDRGAALAAARASEQRAIDQLFASLQSQAEARRTSRQTGQRLESLAAIEKAARIRPAPELRDNAIAAMAMADIQRGPIWRGSNTDLQAVSLDPDYTRYARVDTDGSISVRNLSDDRELQRVKPESALPGSAGIQLQFSPNGQFLAWLDSNRQLSLWRWEGNEAVFKRPLQRCTALAFSPDSRQLALAHDVWITTVNSSTGLEIATWRLADQVHSMDFAHDNRRLAVGYVETEAIDIFNANDGTFLASLPSGKSRNTVVAWHPEGSLLAVAGSDPRIQVWNVNARHQVAVLEGHSEQINFLMFHGGDFLASTSWDGSMRLWRPAPARLLLRLPSSWMGFSQNGQWAGVFSLSNYHAQPWGIVPSREYHTFLNTFMAGESVSREGDISPDGSLLALAASDGVRLWDITRGREVAWLPIEDTTSALFHDGGGELLTCGSADGLQRWRIHKSDEPEGAWQIERSRSITLPFAPTRMTRGDDGRTVAIVGERAGQCVQFDLELETIRGVTMPHTQVAFVAMSANSERLASSGWHSDRVKLWDRASGRLLKELESSLTSRVFFTPDSRELIIARAREFTFHELDSFKVSRRMPREIGLHPGFIAFTADGKMMAVEMAPGLIHLKETTSARTVAKLEDPQGDLSTWMSFTPDGSQLIVAARYAAAIHRWDLRAIRERLKKLNLDWDWPEFATEPSFGPSAARPGVPLRVEVILTPSSTNTTTRNRE